MGPKWIQKDAQTADNSMLRPNGANNCLMNLTFVRTGELNGMTEDQLSTYISVYGGKLTGSVSGKTSYLILGRDPGETKRKAATEKNIPIITEQQLYELVISRSKKQNSAYVPKQCDYQKSIQPFGGEESDNLYEIESSDNKPQTNTQQYVDYCVQYRPKVLSQILGNNSVIQSLKESVQNFSSQNFGLFLYGPSGVGKTLIVRLLAKELGLLPININSSQSRTKKELIERLKCVQQPQSLDKRKLIVVIDEAETVDRGGLPFLNEYLKKIREQNNKTPFIFITSDERHASLKTIRKHCLEFQLRRTPKNLIAKYFSAILKAENVKFQDSQLELLAEKAGGDIRRCVEYLNTFVQGGRLDLKDVLSFEIIKSDGDMFATVDAVFGLQKLAGQEHQPYQLLVDKFFNDSSLVLPAIIQNYPAKCQYDPELMAMIAEDLSFADTIQHKMFTAGDWSSSKANAVITTCVTAINYQQNAPSKREFAWPQFPGVISLEKSIRTKVVSSGRMNSVGMIEPIGACEFAELVTTTAEYELLGGGKGPVVAFIAGCATEDALDELREELGWSKELKKALKGGGMDMLEKVKGK